MGVLSWLTSAWGAAVVTAVKRAHYREHTVSKILDIPALQHSQQHPFLSAATTNRPIIN